MSPQGLLGTLLYMHVWMCFTGGRPFGTQPPSFISLNMILKRSVTCTHIQSLLGFSFNNSYMCGPFFQAWVFIRHSWHLHQLTRNTRALYHKMASNCMFWICCIHDHSFPFQLNNYWYIPNSWMRTYCITVKQDVGVIWWSNRILQENST